MTLVEVSELLKNNGISFEQTEHESQEAYFSHFSMYSYWGPHKNASHKVIVLTVKSPNGKKNIELQFNEVGNEFIFYNFYFGEFDYEMFNYNEEMLADDILTNIRDIMQGDVTIIQRYGRWGSEARYDRDEYDYELKRALERIQRPKGMIARLFRSKSIYEIYDWNTYRSITK